MCLLTTQSKALRAKEDIKVYKLFNVNESGQLKSPYYGHVYENIGRQKTIALGVYKNYRGTPFDNSDALQAGEDKDIGKIINTISEGYHSCKRKSVLESVSFRSTVKIYQCVIPKGAWYYKGYDGLMVSTDLIIFENNNQYEEYKKRKSTKSSQRTV